MPEARQGSDAQRSNAASSSQRDPGRTVKLPNTVLTADELSYLSRIKQSLQAKELRKEKRAAQNLQQRKKKAKSDSPQAAKPKAPKKPRKQTAANSSGQGRAVDEIAATYGITPAIVIQLSKDHGIALRSSARKVRVDREDMTRLRQAIKASTNKVPLEEIANFLDLDLAFVKDSAERIGLNLLPGEKILVKHGVRLVPFLTEAHAEKHRLHGDKHWMAKGEHSARMMEHLQASKTRSSPAPYIQVVSGGLPTLGKGRR